MATFTVTTTTDDANDPGSLRYALTQAANSPGAVIAFNLPANSTINLATRGFPNPTVGQVYDFSGAPGLTITGQANLIRDYVSADVNGALNIGAGGLSAVLVNSPTATLLLRAGVNFTSAATNNPLIFVNTGASVTLEGGARLADSANNTIGVYGGANTQISIGAGAVVSGSNATASVIYIDTPVTGAVVTNAGTISAAGSNALFLGDAGVLNNTGTLSSTGNATTIVFGGAGVINSSGVIRAGSAGAFAIAANNGDTSTGVVAINLLAGSTTVGTIGSNAGVTYRHSIAGTFSGSVFGGTADDTLTLFTNANLAGLVNVNLGAGGNTLVLDGAGTASLNDALVGNVASLVKNGAGTWTLQNATAYTSTALNGGLLEIANVGGAGGGAITFGAGAQTLQIDGRTAGGAFENTLAALGVGDRVDVRGVGLAASAAVVGDTIQLRSSAGVTLYTLNVSSGAALAGLVVNVADDTAGGTTLSLVAPPVLPQPITPTTILTPSQQAGLATEINNLSRAGASDAATPTLTDANGVVFVNPVYAQIQAENSIAVQLDGKQISTADAQNALYRLVDGTTSVAEISYAFFTGRTPTAAGLNFLVHSSSNTTDLNDAYYAKFSTENRYINFAVNLAGPQGAGAATFQAAYGGLSLADATAKAYQAVFGTAADAAKVSAILNASVPDGVGGTETRAQYFAQYGGDGPNGTGTKAAMVGFLLADSVKEGFGVYQQADLHFLADLAHGTALFNVDLLATYGPPAGLVGAPVADPTLPG